MIWNRFALAASVLASVGLLLDTTTAAASPDGRNEAENSVSAKVPAHEALPRGVHRKRNGQYVRSICPETSSLHCLAKQLLPGNYVPGVSEILPPVAMSVTSVPQPDGLGPAQIAAAYNLSTLPPGTGNIVAIVDSYDYYAVSDLAGYRAGYGLPALPTCPAATNGGFPVPGGTPCFAAVDESGALHTATKSEDNTAVTEADFETALDMDMVSAACPACSILLVQLTGAEEDAGNGSGDLLAAVQAASKLGAVAISISLGEPESTDPLIGSKVPDPSGYTTPGHLVFVASGDFGYDNETACGAEDAGCGNETLTTPSYPASAPDVIAVGGTALYNAGGAGTYTETVWDDGFPNAQDVTTSGCSSEFAALSWQTSQTKLPTTTCKMRATADVSASAAYATSKTPPTTIQQALDTDIIIYTTSDPTLGVNGFAGGAEGTSAASPMMAAIFARIGLATTTSSSLGWPYLNQGAFNDITSGTDDVNSIADAAFDGFQFPAQCTGANLLLCTAGVGWDGPTGVGTPNGAKLLAAIGGTPVTGGTPDSGPNVALDSGPIGETSPPTTPTGSSGGCSCEAMGAGANGFGASALLVGLAALASRRRRSR